jgi:hypothetical protein
MRFNRARWSILLVLVFCIAASFQPRVRSSSQYYASGAFLISESPQPAAVAPKPQGAVEAINSGDTVSGSISGKINDCLLAEKQYKIEFPGGARKLIIELTANGSLNLYARRGAPVAIENGNVVADYRSPFAATTQRLLLPSPSSFSGSLSLLQPGTYFIAITNCLFDGASFTLTAKIQGPPDADFVSLNPNETTVGSITAPATGFCLRGRTQYAVASVTVPCLGGAFQIITVVADQKINVYTRKTRPITEENDLVIYDTVTPTQATSQNIFLPFNSFETAQFFIAIENCNSSPVNYVVSTTLMFGDPPLLTITGASLKKKDLLVFGIGLTEGMPVLIDGQPQPTIYGGKDSGQRDILIVKKWKKKIAGRQSVIITVLRGDCQSAPFSFVIP